MAHNCASAACPCRTPYYKMTDEEIRREYFTKHDRYFALLRPQDQKDVIAGICVMSVSEGRPVLDYTGRWGE
jgi:hypothetical protein